MMGQHQVDASALLVQPVGKQKLRHLDVDPDQYRLYFMVKVAMQDPAVGIRIDQLITVEDGPVLGLELLVRSFIVLEVLLGGGAAARVRVHTGPDGQIKEVP
jgi:hypothetical protein